MIRRHAITHAALGLLTAAALALTGCTDTSSNTDNRDGTPVSRDSNPPPDARAALTQAAARLQDDTFKMTMKITTASGKAQLTGVMDPKKKIGTFTATSSREGSTRTTEWRVLGTVLYVKTSKPATGLPSTPDKPWHRLNPGTSDTSSDDFNGAQMAKALEKAVTVKRSGDTFTGTLDLTVAAKAIGAPTPSPNPSASASADAPKSVPFEAGMDDRGRLTRYHLEIPNRTGNTQKVDIAYSGFGTPVKVQAPAADQIAEPATR